MVHPSTCDTLPLDKSKTHLHPALPYIIWGLVPDIKNKIERDPNWKKFAGSLASQD